MRATALRAVRTLEDGDLLQISEDTRFFEVVAIEQSSGVSDAQYKVRLRSIDRTSSVTLVRSAREMVLTVPRAFHPTARRKVDA